MNNIPKTFLGRVWYVLKYPIYVPLIVIGLSIVLYLILGKNSIGLISMLSTLGGILFLLFRLQRKQEITDIPFTSLSTRRTCLLIVLAVFLSLFVSLSLDLLIEWNLYPKDEETKDLLKGVSRGIFGGLATAVFGPFLEELVFRGVVQKRLMAFIGTLPAVLISSLLFGMAHMNLYQMIYATFLGILLGYIFIWTRTLWAPILLHCVYNLISVIHTQFDEERVFGIPVSQPMAISLVVLSGIAIAAAVIKMYQNRETGEWKNQALEAEEQTASPDDSSIP